MKRSEEENFPTSGYIVSVKNRYVASTHSTTAYNYYYSTTTNSFRLFSPVFIPSVYNT